MKRSLIKEKSETTLDEKNVHGNSLISYHAGPDFSKSVILILTGTWDVEASTPECTPVTVTMFAIDKPHDVNIQLRTGNAFMLIKRMTSLRLPGMR
jgi:hypothetical protein